MFKRREIDNKQGSVLNRGRAQGLTRIPKLQGGESQSLIFNKTCIITELDQEGSRGRVRTRLSAPHSLVSKSFTCKLPDSDTVCEVRFIV